MPDSDSSLHPTFSSTPFFCDRSGLAAGNGEELDGESWRGGFTSGTGVGIHSTPRVSYYFPKGVGEYHFGERHPMKPHRLTLTNHLVVGYGLHKKMDVYHPRSATKEELETFHDEDYIDFLMRVTPENVRNFTNVLARFNVGDDCPIFSDMYDYCRQYAGASLMAGRKIVSGSTDIAINWTGGLHHAKKAEASGFCYVNDIVLCILELLRVHARVLYIDIDIHHGDGVQEAFYNSNRVLTVSFHKYSSDFFPGTGHIDEVGHSLGKYFSLNVPLQDGIDNESYVALFKSIMEPSIATFQPSSIVLQCGADSLGCDRLGCFNLSIAAHGECVRFIKSFNIPLVVLGGGGYTIKNVSRCWTYETAVLLDLHSTLSNSLPHTAYDDFFTPDWKLHPDLAAGRNRVENLNTRKALERIRIGCLERLRYMHGAPSVGMVEIPPSLAPWLKEETKDEDDADERVDGHRGNGEWYDGDRERGGGGEDGGSLLGGGGGGGGFNGAMGAFGGAFGGFSAQVYQPPAHIPGIAGWGLTGGREKRAAAEKATASLASGSLIENARERHIISPAVAASTANARAVKALKAAQAAKEGIVLPPTTVGPGGRKKRRSAGTAGTTGNAPRNPLGKNGRTTIVIPAAGPEGGLNAVEGASAAPVSASVDGASSTNEAGSTVAEGDRSMDTS